MSTPYLPPHINSIVIALGPAGYQNIMAQLQGSSSTSYQQLIANTYHGVQTRPAPSSSAVAQQTKKKRSLNCFVAFRCYISPIFEKFQQKNRSGLVKTLWDSEQNKAKWAIVAKAYSIIRDEVGTKNAPLDDYLALACPEIGLIARENYLHTFGWELVLQAGSWGLIRRFTPDLNSFPENFFTTNLSAEDMVRYVRNQGYGITSQDTAVIINHGGAALAMAAHPAPTASYSAPATAHGTHQLAHLAPNVAQAAPQNAQPATETAQVTESSQHQSNPDDNGSAALGTNADYGFNPESDQFLNYLDPDLGAQCTLDRKNFADPWLYSRSINRQIPIGNTIRPYYPAGSGTSPVVHGPPADKSDPLSYGNNALASLAKDFWESGSEWPHDDQFIPGEQYPTFSDRMVLPDFDAFDINDPSSWPSF
ncbi:Mating-type protein MAT alpha 1 [Macrophomina phaseolina MS6]|uniref:Mating-type protein MAT-1 n=2 Tax=Macrophomina phaseolina TaxID=35725 RepID=K2S4F6_MACPH|nr:Mating-type protein MAT alpha 1 [Macrophomina phaseolina MS6]KAH7057339.1 mating-type protein MAT alpha 1-domain-containing protein [Macrophomina phaseolina]